MTDNEMIEALQTLLKPISNKLEELDIKVDQIRLDNKMTTRVIRKDIKYLNDEVDTLIEVMEAKGVLPKVE